MSAKKLLAKKWIEATPPPEELTLKAHSEKVAQIFEKIINLAGEKILASLDLQAEEWLPRLKKAAKVSSILHDLGKTSKSFQDMLSGKPRYRNQPARHELLSGVLTFPGEPLHEYLLQELEVDSFTDPLVLATLGAVLGHHVKVDASWQKAALALSEGGCGENITLLLQDLDLEGFPQLKNKSWSLDEPRYLKDYLILFRKYNKDWKKILEKDPEWKRFAGVLKALLMAADVLASALPQDYSGETWAEETLSTVLTAADTQKIVEARLNGKKIRPFQAAIGQATSRVTLVQAGCGSGKTIGAYLWAKNHADNRKLFFCYPTTGTATEGFLGYVADNEIEASLIHSRAEIDLEKIYLSGDEDEKNELINIASLNTWNAAINICTIDTVLSLIRNNKKGLYASPALLTASFVFDEIHSYDQRMFDGMLNFIKALPGVSFLLMSASLPSGRLAAIQKLFPETTLIAAPEDLEKIPRYQIAKVSVVNEQIFEDVKKCIQEHKKVLWIVNTVKKAQELYKLAKDKKIPVITYHSRFRYQDRVTRHSAVIDAFLASAGILVITTQVAEMSLDLDADFLISDLASIPAMIQRLGRLNRRVTPTNQGTPRKAVFIDYNEKRPYDLEELQKGRAWLDKLIKSNPVAQQDLTSVFLEIETETEEIKLYSEWLDEGLVSQSGEIREPGYTVPVIFETDLKFCQKDHKEVKFKEIPLLYIPFIMDTWDKYKYHFIAPTGALKYNEESGAEWEEN